MVKRMQRIVVLMGAALLSGLLLAGLGFSLAEASRSALFVVNDNGDLPDANLLDGACDTGSGACTLRAAIEQANALPGTDSIEFSALPAANNVIPVGAPLPLITDSVNIFGHTHPAGMVELDGNGVTGAGFHVTAGGSTIVNMRIHSFNGHGIHLAGSGGNTVQDNIIGQPAEALGAGNTGDGIYVDDVGNNLVKDNIIGNNGQHGIELAGSGATFNTVQGNRVGTNPAGTAAQPNGGSGLRLLNAPQNIIGGSSAGQGNLLSGNTSHGIALAGIPTTQNAILGNYIGTNLPGTAGLPNGGHGIFLNEAGQNTIGGAAAGAGNLISANSRSGLFIAGNGGSNNQVMGNYIGTSASGLAGLGNGEHGVQINHGRDNIIGGLVAGSGNLISANTENGVSITSDEDLGPGTGAQNNQIVGNLIGADVNGSSALGNGQAGVLIDRADENVVGGTTAAARNVIAGNSGAGVTVGDQNSNDNDIFGNFIGTNISGTASLANGGDGVYINNAPFTRVGSTTAGSGNVIAGNGGSGVHIRGVQARYNNVQANLIGLDVNGTTVISNSNHGVRIEDGSYNVVGATTSAGRNIISGNAQHGILVVGLLAQHNQVVGNYIGTDSSGGLDRGNGGAGVQVTQGNFSQIGSPTAGNLIAGNGQHGIQLNFGMSLTVQANQIGSGVQPGGNDGGGILLNGTSYALVGGTTAAARNIIVGNGGHGLHLTGGAYANAVQGNYIGVFANGVSYLGNQGDGVHLNNGVANVIGGAQSGAGNLIGGNSSDGVELSSTQATTNTIQGNLIGLDAAGTAPILNGGSGVSVQAGARDNQIGGSGSGGNVINAGMNDGVNIGCGVTVPGSTGTIIQGNRIGTNADGTAALRTAYPLANGHYGLNICGDNTLVGGPTAGHGNLVAGNGVHGIYAYRVTTLTLQHNYVGVNVAGSSALPNQNDGVNIELSQSITILNNLVSGNGSDGFSMRVTTATIQGNLVGTNSAGTAIIANGGDGFAASFGDAVLFGGSAAGTENVIAGNQGCGLQIYDYNATTIPLRIIGNYIGTNGIGSSDIGNGGHGICLDTGNVSGMTYMQIGGVGAGEGNVIAYNGGAGIYFDDFTANTGWPVRGNLIFSNQGLGIDLYPNGVTANDVGDSDNGPQQLQNFPILQSVAQGSTIIEGDLDSAPNTNYLLDFYMSASCDPSGHGEAETYLGAYAVTTDATGTVHFQVTFPQTIPAAHYVSATATDANGNTSEFSPCVQEPTPAPTAIELSHLAVSQPAGPGLLGWLGLVLGGMTALIVWRRRGEGTAG